MENPSLLITAGCSFSTAQNEHSTWPVHLNDYLRPKDIVYLGSGGIGNGIISRRVIYNVTQYLKKYEPKDILVGIMWSSYDRYEVYSKEPISHTHKDLEPTLTNPIAVSQDKNFYIINPYWDDKSTVLYYKYFYNEHHAAMLTLEHILRVQWFLKIHNIKYFMALYGPNALPISDHPIQREILANPDIKYLYDSIDKNHWLPIDTMYDFALNSGLTFPGPDMHPGTEQHKLFTDTVIIPHLKNKGYIN